MQKTCKSIQAIFFSFGLSLSAWAPMVPFTKDRLDLNEAELGLILLVLGIGALIMMPITGWLIKQVGSKKIVLVSGLLIAFLIPCLTIPDTTTGMCCVLLAYGIATGAMNVAMNSQSVDIEKAANSSILSGIHGWFSVGGLIGATSMSLILERGFSLLFAAQFISFLVFVLVVFNWKHLLDFEKPSENQVKNESWQHPQVFILGALCFIAFMAEGSMLDWSAEFLHANADFDTSIAGLGYSFFSISMALGRYTGDRMIQKLGVPLMFQLGTFIAATGFFVVVSLHWAYLEFLGFSLIGFGAANIVPILFGSSGKIPRVSSSAALTVVTTFGYVGCLIGPALIGFIAKFFSLPLAFMIVAIFLVFIGFIGKKAIQRPQIA